MDPVENFFSPYAGMHNNPISQVDPDGRFPLIAIAIGALTNAVIQNYKGNINNFGDFVSAMAIGAVKGAGSYAVGQFVGGIVGSNSLSLADEGVGVFASSDPTLLDEILLTASRGGGFDFSNTVSTLLSFGGCVYGGFGTPDFNMNLYPNSTLLPTVDVYAYQNVSLKTDGFSYYGGSPPIPGRSSILKIFKNIPSWIKSFKYGMNFAAKGGGNVIPKGKLANHLFKGSGKLVDNPANRTLISRISNGKPLVVDEFGKSWFRGVDASGRGIYSYTQNGIVKGSGYTNLSAAEIIAKYSVK